MSGERKVGAAELVGVVRCFCRDNVKDREGALEVEATSGLAQPKLAQQVRLGRMLSDYDCERCLITPISLSFAEKLQRC